MPGLFMWFLIFVVAICCLRVHSIDVSTSWLTDTIIGTNATLQCGWTAATGETPATLFLSPKNNSYANYFTCLIYAYPPHACTRGPSALEKYSIATSLQGSVSILITKLSCSDDGTQYYCIVSNNSMSPAISHSLLRVKVPPTVPTLSNIQTGVKENSNITATCTADVGYPNAGQIIWKAYQNGRSVELPSGIVIASMNVTQPGDDQCTVRTQSSVTLIANRFHQDISFACFVISPGSTSPDTCNQATDLCAQTGPAVVTYENITQISTTTVTTTSTGTVSSEAITAISESDENITQISTTTVTTTSTGTDSSEAITAISESDCNTVSMIAMSVILSAIIIVQFVAIIYLLFRVKDMHLKENKATKKEPRVYDRTVTDPHYIYVDDIHSYATAS